MTAIVTPQTGDASSARPSFPIGARNYTPSDVTFFTRPASIYVGGGGNLVVQPFSGEANVTLTNFPSGAVIPFGVRQVLSTGTTATNIVAIY